MAEPDMDEEDLFADLYDADDNQVSKDQIPIKSEPEPTAPISKPTETAGYGVEPESHHDPTSFDTEAFDTAMTTNGGDVDIKEESGGDYRVESPGIQMKEDGIDLELSNKEVRVVEFLTPAGPECGLRIWQVGSKQRFHQACKEDECWLAKGNTSPTSQSNESLVDGKRSSR